MNQNDPNILKMVDRACAIIEYLYQMDGAGSISALSKDLDLPKANVFRILYTMQQHGLIEKEMDTDRYRLGKALIKYGEKVRYDVDLVERAKPFMKKAAKTLAKTINIGIEHEGQVVTLHSEEGEKSVLVSRLIPISELHCSSMGKLALSEMTEGEQRAYFKQNVLKRTVNTLVDYKAFEPELEEIRKTGLAYDREEYEYGLSCIAAPIRSNGGDLMAMVSVSGPTTRLEFKGIEKVIEELKKLAVELSGEL